MTQDSPTQKLPDDVLFDVRLQERHRARGLLTAEALQRHLDALPDRADHALSIDIDKLAHRR